MESDDVAGVGALPLEHMAGRDILQGHRYPRLQLEEAGAELGRVLPCFATIALDSCRLKEAWLVLQVWRADNQVSFHRSLLHFVAVMLELVELLLELDHLLQISLRGLVELDHEGMLVDLLHHGIDEPDKPVDGHNGVLRLRVIPVKRQILLVVVPFTVDFVHIKLAFAKDVEPEVDWHVLDVQLLGGLVSTFSSDNERADDLSTHRVGLGHEGSEGVHVEGHGVDFRWTWKLSVT